MQRALEQECARHPQSDACSDAAKPELLRDLLTTEIEAQGASEPLRVLTAAWIDCVEQWNVIQIVEDVRWESSGGDTPDQEDDAVAARMREILARRRDYFDRPSRYGTSWLAQRVITRYTNANFGDDKIRDGWEIFSNRCFDLVWDLEDMVRRQPETGLRDGEICDSWGRLLDHAKQDALDWPPSHARFVPLLRETEDGGWWVIRVLPTRSSLATERDLRNLLEKRDKLTLLEHIDRRARWSTFHTFGPPLLLFLAFAIGNPPGALKLSVTAMIAVSSLALLIGGLAVLWFISEWVSTHGFPVHEWSEQHKIGKELAAAVAQDADLYEKCIRTGLLRVRAMRTAFK